MKSKMVSINQVALILFMTVISLKFLVFPAVVAYYSGFDGYICMITGLLIDFILFFAYYYCIKTNPDKTFKQLLNESFGSIITKIIFGILSLFFLIKSLFITKEIYNYFLKTLFDELSFFSFAVPLFVLLIFMINKDFRVIGRVLELLFVLIMIGIVLSFILPVSSFELINILPFFKNGVSSVASGTVSISFAFGDYLVLVCLMGNIKYEQAKLKYLWITVAIAVFVVALYYILFFGVYSDISILEGTSVSDISLHSLFPNTLGRLDWLSIFLWSLTLILELVIYIMSTKHCFDNMIKFKNKNISSAIILALLLIGLIIFYNSIEMILGFVTSLPFAIISIVIQTGIPLLILILLIVKRPKKTKSRLPYEQVV